MQLHIKPEVSVIDQKVFYNTGGCFDIITGEFMSGIHGEQILNGGVGNVTGFIGPPNVYKTTMLWFFLNMILIRYNRIGNGNYRGQGYDTEINASLARPTHLFDALLKYGAPELGITEDFNPFRSGDFLMTDSVKHLGDEWFDKYKEFTEKKVKIGDKITITTPFRDTRNGNLIKVLLPTVSSIDSLSEFITENTTKMQNSASLGEKEGNMLYMKQGNDKNRLVQELPRLCGNANDLMFMTAHLGKEFALDPRQPPRKALQHLQQGLKIKGVPEKFSFATNNCWYCQSSSVAYNDSSSRLPQYPLNRNDDLKGSTDLNFVTVLNLRGKSGLTGLKIEIIISQKDGFLPALTEFHLLKTMANNYGMEGNVQNYNLCVLPDVKLSRTVVRGKLEEDAVLRRAMNLTSEIAQAQLFYPGINPKYMQPMEIYLKKLVDLGYNIPSLLNTRGWWTYDNEKQKTPFLSSRDFLNMANGEYIPYWMGDAPAKAREAVAAHRATK